MGCKIINRITTFNAGKQYSTQVDKYKNNITKITRMLLWMTQKLQLYPFRMNIRNSCPFAFPDCLHNASLVFWFHLQKAHCTAQHTRKSTQSKQYQMQNGSVLFAEMYIFMRHATFYLQQAKMRFFTMHSFSYHTSCLEKLDLTFGCMSLIKKEL